MIIMIRITILGSSAAMPSPERNLPGIAIKYNGKVYLFDCGEGSQRQMMKYHVGYGSVKGIFVSHLHPDHYLGIAGLLYTLDMNGRTEELIIKGPAGFARNITNLMNGKLPKFVRLEEYKEGIIYEEKEFQITAIRVKHNGNAHAFIFEEKPKVKFYEDKAKSLGIRGRLFREIQEKGELEINGNRVSLEEVTWIKKGRKIAYSGDTLYCEKFVESAKECDLMIHDGTFRESEREDAYEKMHATVRDAALAAKNSSAKKLIITHISPRYKDPGVLLKEAKEVFEESYIAEDGMNIEI